MNSTLPEVLEKWRQEFESIFADESPRFEKSGRYINSHKESMWQGWLFARQSVHIELPHTRPFGEDDCDHFYNEGLFDCSRAIQCQGYKVNN